MNGLRRWRQRYTECALATIPLPAGAKAPPTIGRDWQHISPAKQWRKAGVHFRGNIGLLAGGGLAIIDCDAKDTEHAVHAWLAGLGIATPTVRTPHGLHAYLRCGDVPDAFNWAHLACGPGELRARNSYTVAPPSIVNGRRYRFESGRLESIGRVKWRDLSTLVKPGVASAPMDAPPLPLLHRHMPAKTRKLLRQLHRRPVYMPMANGSRSEHEASVVSSLIVSGWSYDDIAETFEKWRPGHYVECGEHRFAYLERTHHRVLGWLAACGERPAIVELYRDASSMAWPTRSGLHDRATFLALLSLCWQYGSFEVHASVRDLAVLSAKSTKGVRNALRRLARAGLIERVADAELVERATDAELARQVLAGKLVDISPRMTGARWRVYAPKVPICHTLVPIGRTGSGDRVPGGSQNSQDIMCEVWGWHGLGRSAGAVHDALSSEPASVGDLAVATGKHRNTVGRALGKLAKYGLAERVSGGWRRGTGSLADVAETVDAQGHHDTRRRRVEHDRAIWRRLLASTRSI